jgi:uncharacterized protein YegL
MRRLPIYFLIDISESMVGEPIQQVEEGISEIIQTLKKDPNAIETVWVSIIVFAGQAKTLVPLQELITFYPPKFPVGSGTSLSKGLDHLMIELEKNIVKTTSDKKGDWKPIVFLFTDGVPTDDTKATISAWKRDWIRKANLIAISFGSDTDTQLLAELTETVLLFNNTNATAYKQFFKWVTDSIKTSSVSVDHHLGSDELAKVDGQTLLQIDLTKLKNTTPIIDNNYVILSGMCQNNQRPYLIKYRRRVEPNNIGGLELETICYKLVGAFQVDNSYFELSVTTSADFTINTEELIGAPTCPCCGNQFAFAVCSCGKIHCIGEDEVNICPWCGNQGTYGIGEGGFDVNRKQG